MPARAMADQVAASTMRDARTFAAAMFRSLRRTDLAAIVAAGEGDDFPEVSMAAALLAERADQLARQEDALRQYADPGFWEDTGPGGSLASHDRGEMARNVLSGRPAFFHRD